MTEIKTSFERRQNRMNECAKKHQTVTDLTRYSYFVPVVMGHGMTIDSIL